MIGDKKRKLTDLRNIWGSEFDQQRNFELIKKYHQKVLIKNNEDIVDEKTWNDLNFDKIFSIIDRNLTPVGQQRLFHFMHVYQRDENELNKRMEITEHFKNNQTDREKIQLELMGLSDTNSYYIPDIVFDKLPPRPKFYYLFYLMSLLSALSIVMIFFNKVFLFAALGFGLTNMIINKVYGKKIYVYFSGFSSLNSLLNIAKKLARIKTEKEIPQLIKLKKLRHLVNNLSKKIGYLVVDKTRMNDLVAILNEYMNMILLLDIIAYSRSVNKLSHYQKEIGEVFNAIGDLDSCISVASYLSGVRYYTKPEFSEELEILLENVYHPLLDDPVPTSIDKMKKSALITGSNMAGKTTFIKNIGINTILAQTLNFALAEKAIIPRIVVMSSIRREDSIENSKSYYFVEVEEMQKFIDISVENKRYLFLIDEIFRGTNTVERLAASTSVLSYLSRTNLLLVTTHDIELQYLLKNNFSMFNFSEQVKDDEYYFDYKLRSGPTSSGNAIRLLEIKGYPESITNEARALVKEMLENSSVREEMFKNAKRPG